MKSKIAYFLTAALMLLSGCAKYEDTFYGSLDASPGKHREFLGVVSVMQDADGETVLHSGDVYVCPEDFNYTGRMRAMCCMYIRPKSEGQKYPAAIIDWMEKLDQGELSSSFASKANDGVDVIVSSGLTCLEDGFLTLYYTAWWGEHPVHHDFFLETDPADPCSLELKHDAHGDGHHELSEGLVFFDISELPGMAGEKLTLKWTGTDGTERSAQFDFDTLPQ